jgi:protein gp37
VNQPGRAQEPNFGSWRLWDPIVGCEAISPGCAHCWAAAAVQDRASRAGDQGSQAWSALTTPDGTWSGEIRADPDLVRAPLGWDTPRRVVLGSLSDLFHPRVEARTIAALFEVVASSPQITYRMLTKRSKRMLHLGNEGLAFPPNLWIGVSIESDEFTWRAEDLLRLNAALIWVSVEPMLGPVPSLPVAALGCVVCAGEIGQGSRPVDTTWVRDLRDACVLSGVPFRYGGLGDEPGLSEPAGLPVLDGEIWAEVPVAP